MTKPRTKAMDSLLHGRLLLPFRALGITSIFALLFLIAASSMNAAVVQFRKPRYTAGEFNYSLSMAGTVMVDVLHTHRKDVATVHYETSPIDAVPGRDYTHVSGTLSIYPGERVTWIEIPVFYDWDNDTPVRFNITLSEPGARTQIGRRSVTTITLINSVWDPFLALKTRERIIILDDTQRIRFDQRMPSSGSFITDWGVLESYPLQPHKITCGFSVSEIRAGPTVCYGFSCFSTFYAAALGTDRVTFEFTSPYGGTYTNADSQYFMFGPGGTFELPGPKPE